jgi:GT2 family glycosyltransferase
MKLLVVIVAFNGAKWLRQSLPELLKSNQLDIYIRDNSAEPETKAYIQSLNSPQIAFESGPNVGFGQGNNLGFKFGAVHGYQWFFLLNQDAKVDGVKLCQWVYSIRQKTTPTIHCPIQLNWDNDRANFNFEKRYAPGWSKHKNPFPSEFVNAAAWLIHIDTLKQVGGFNPIFHMYGEDRDWVKRLRKQGGSVLVHPSIQVRHFSSAQAKSKDKLWVAWTKTYSEEIHHFFEVSHSSNPGSGYIRRAIRRAFKREYLALNLRLIQPITEIKVLKTLLKQKERLRVLKKQSDQSEFRFILEHDDFL